MSNCGQCGGGGITCTCFVENNCYPVDFFVDLPGTTGNYASTPDSAAVSITGDIDIRVKLSADDWTPAVVSNLIAKRTTGQKSWRLYLGSTGALFFQASVDGSTDVTASASSVVTGFANGSVGWVRVTWRQSDGRVQYFTSINGTTWTQLGIDRSLVIASLFDSTTSVLLGANAGATGEMLAGNVYYAEIRNGIDGTVVAKFDPDDSTITPTPTTKTPSSFTSGTGEVWTLNGADWVWGSDEVCVEARGNGSLSHPFNFVPNHIPNPRPCGNISRLTTVQTILASTDTAVIFNTDSHPFTGSMTNLVGTPTRLTAPVQGIYLVGGFVALSYPGAANASRLFIRKNGLGSGIVRKANQDPNSSAYIMLDVISLVALAAGDYIELCVFTTLGLNVDFFNPNSSDYCPAYLWAQWMGF